MFKSKKIDEFGGQSGNEENTEDVTVTEEKIIGEDGVERTIIKKTTTRRTVQTKQVNQGAKVTTTKRTVYSSDGKELTNEFHSKLGFDDKKSIEHSKKKGGSDSSSSDDEGFGQKIKSLLKGSKSKDGKEQSAIKASPHSATSKDEPSSKPTADDNEFAQDCLKWHNHYRQKHGVKPLKLSPELTKYAKEWVNDIAKRDVLEHRPHNVHGENIFMKWSTDPNFKISGRDPVENWYSEIKDHVFGKEPKSLASGHFTQVVWKASEELGVARAKSKSGKILVVANYNPAGNIIGSFAANVPQAK